MRCPRPIVALNGSVPCGQCLPCRINRQRAWAARILLEHSTSPSSWFVTLTYSEETVPFEGELRTLCKKDVQDWVKRVRKALPYVTVRYFAVGEYGDRTWRPHYHAALFFDDPNVNVDRLLERTWTLGHWSVAELNSSRAMYLAHYTTKKMTRERTDFERNQLKGRAPEFALQSRKPGLGHAGALSIADALDSHSGIADIADRGDINAEFRHDGRKWPLDNYLRKVIRLALGIPELARDRYDGPTKRRPPPVHETKWVPEAPGSEVHKPFYPGESARVHAAERRAYRARRLHPRAL